MEDKYKGWLKAEFIKEIERLQRIIENYKEVESTVYWSQGKNERGAGRKTKLDEKIKLQIKEYRNSGLTYKAIAEKMGLSVGVVHKGSQ